MPKYLAVNEGDFKFLQAAMRSINLTDDYFDEDEWIGHRVKIDVVKSFYTLTGDILRYKVHQSVPDFMTHCEMQEMGSWTLRKVYDYYQIFHINCDDFMGSELIVHMEFIQDLLKYGKTEVRFDHGKIALLIGH